MSKKEAIISVIKAQGTIPLFYHDSETITIGTVEALYQAGIRVFEYTNRGDNALSNFKALVKVRDEKWKDLYLGIGTIKTVNDVHNYAEAKADFIICPGVFPEVAEACKKLNLFWVPGCMTPTEIVSAEACGAYLVKIFPGNVVGAGFVSAVKDLFPKLLFMPTGGVDGTEENLTTWFKAGVVAVGMGSKLIDKKTLDEQLYTSLTERTIQALALIKKIIAQH
jgi:2-dehydro-3-deoxyphosphogluconate aldolase / (4S)-4-hydroxy-2-oxoglutarate aldolase